MPIAIKWQDGDMDKTAAYAMRDDMLKERGLLPGKSCKKRPAAAPQLELSAGSTLPAEEPAHHDEESTPQVTSEGGVDDPLSGIPFWDNASLPPF